MAKSLVTRLEERRQQLRKSSATVRATSQDLADFILPTRGKINRKTNEGQEQTDYLFDSTAIDANDKLASFVGSALTNPAIQWFLLKVEDEELNASVEVREWLDKVANVIMTQFRASNFGTEIQEIYRDLGAFGTACLWHEEKNSDAPGLFGGFRFKAEAIGSYEIGEDADGRVDTVFRTLEMSLRAVKNKYGEEALSQKMKQKIVKNPDERVTLIHAIFPREEGRFGFGKTKTRRPIASIIYDPDEKHKVDEDGFFEMPVYVVRWTKTSGEMWGRGPGHTALPDIRTLNKAIELTLMAWGKIVDPPLNVKDDGVIGRVSTWPAALNVVRDDDAIVPMPQGGQFDVNAQLVSDVRAQIRAIFFSDQLQLPNKTIITATEVERRIELMQQILGPVVGRLEFELLSPLVNRAFQALLRRGMLPPPPATLAQFAGDNGVGLVVSYEGPLARAQRSADIKATNDLIGFIQQIDPIWPTAKDKIKIDELVERRAKTTGVPAEIIRDEDEVGEVRTQRAEENAADAEAAAGAEQARSFKDLAQGAKNLSQADPQALQQQAAAVDPSLIEGV